MGADGGRHHARREPGASPLGKRRGHGRGRLASCDQPDRTGTKQSRMLRDALKGAPHQQRRGGRIDASSGDLYHVLA